MTRQNNWAWFGVTKLATSCPPLWQDNAESTRPSTVGRSSGRLHGAEFSLFLAPSFDVIVQMLVVWILRAPCTVGSSVTLKF